MTVFEKMLARCEAAFLAKTPIIYVCTDEIEMIRQVVNSDKLVTRLVRISDIKGEYDFRPCEANETIKKAENYKTGLPGGIGDFDKNSITVPQITVVHLQSAMAETQFDGLVKYVEAYISDGDDNSALRCSAMLLYGGRFVLPDSLIPYTEIVEVDFPDEIEVAEIIAEMLTLHNAPSFEDSRDMDDLTTSLMGFSCVQIRKLLHRILSADAENGTNCIFNLDKVSEIVRSSKEQIIKRGQVLELEKIRAGKDEIGGMSRFEDWLKAQKENVLHSAKLQQEMGIEPPKGVLLCGVPGCGKSLAAGVLGAKLGIPLLKMDVGRLMGRYVGESEHNMLLALKQAEAMSPCILWIDELDKGFSNASSGGSDDSGVFKRMFGSLLTWMQNNNKPCFIFATANSIAGMPKEFFRSGRFDALFSVFMPTFDECVEILRKRMEKAASAAKKKLFSDACYDDKNLESIVAAFGKPSAPRFVTGADIQKIVNMALAHIYHSGSSTEIAPNEWSCAINSVMPMTTVYGDGTENLDSIAACYIRLIRNNFSPVARSVLFDSSEYHVEYGDSGEVRVRLDSKPDSVLDSMPEYDKAMYLKLRERIEQLAPMIERVERDRLLR